MQLIFAPIEGKAQNIKREHLCAKDTTKRRIDTDLISDFSMNKTAM
jgi:hypothetical protein